MKGGEHSMKYLPWILAVIGSWLVAAPFTLGYEQTELAMQNDVAVGVVMVIGALFWWFSGMRRHRLSADMQTQRR